MAIAENGARLAPGFHALAPGDLAAVVTALEMREAPASLRRLVPEQDVPLQLVRWKAPDLAKYRLLFRRVGAKWLWWSRLALDDAALGAIIHDPQVHVFAVADRAGVEVGMLELDFRKAGEAEIAFFGLIPGATGKGFGKWGFADDPREMARLMIAHIDKKRQALGIDKTRERVLMDMADRRDLDATV